MAAPYDLNDDSVVVIIGSGAGGGTLGQRAGAEGRSTRSSSKRADATKPKTSSMTSGTVSANSPGPTCARRRASGGWRRDFANLARMDRESGRRLDHALGGRILRFQEHEWRAATEYGGIEGANLLDWPITLGGHGAVLRQGRRQDGRDPHQRHSRPARQQQLQGHGSRGEKARLQGGPYRAAWRSTRRIAMDAGIASSRASASRAASSRRNGPRWWPKFRRARRRASWKSGPTRMC